MRKLKSRVEDVFSKIESCKHLDDLLLLQNDVYKVFLCCGCLRAVRYNPSSRWIPLKEPFEGVLGDLPFLCKS